ncbi:replication-relaxation family protein [Streptomyces sp. NBC_01433]|uniref:replication-relaxation family protein n=1 Tax=Streptomyces sp. NBC_01433 TaxID=2903864 RepID=UPI002B1CD3B2|nr:replication-relaxation family protein [Streptomyces sp. NBC_01433]
MSFDDTGHRVPVTVQNSLWTWSRDVPRARRRLISSAVSSAVKDSAAAPIAAGQARGQGGVTDADTSLPVPPASGGQRSSTPTAPRVRGDALRMLACVRVATARQMARVITAEDTDGRSYVRRAMRKLAEQGLVETNGKQGKELIWNLTRAGLRAVADGNELPARPRAGTGAKAVRAGFGPHALAVTETILTFGGRQHLTDWQVEVNHAIKETGLTFNTDAVLASPGKTFEVRLFEIDNGTMSRAKLAREVWDYERYAGHRVWEGARGTIGGTFPFWSRYRYTRSEQFPPLHVVLAGKEEHLLKRRLEALAEAVDGITVSVFATTLPALQRREKWVRLGTDNPGRRRERYPEPVSR